MAYPLAEPERWTWHTGIYAFRCIVLDKPIEPGSPVDLDGKYFDKQLVDYEVHRQRSKRQPAPLLNRKRDDETLAGRALCNEYARSKGFASFDVAYDAGAISYGEVARWALAGGLRRMPGSGSEPAEYDLAQMQKDLGLSAKEYQPTPEEMRASRAALGIAIETATSTTEERIDGTISPRV